MDTSTRITQLARRCGPSYRRRWPGNELIAEISELERSLPDPVNPDPANSQAWLKERCQLAQMRLDYDLASSLVQQLLALHPSQREWLTLQAAIGAEREFWRSLGLSPAELQSLGDFLEEQEVDPDEEPESADDLRHTHAWIDRHCPERRARIIEGLQAQGGFCDAEVLANVVT